MKTKKETEPMDEAYKMLDGAPSATGVSDAAKGIHPKKDTEQYEEDEGEKHARLYDPMKHDEEGKELVGEDKDAYEKGKHEYKQDSKCGDINEAYSMLFEALAIITKA